MKYLIFIFATLIVSCRESNNTETDTTSIDSGVTQPTTAAISADTVIKDQSKITAIRAAVQRINSQTLQVQSFNWSEPSCADVGTIAYYLNGDEIVKVIETGFIGDGGWTKEYYYDGGKYIFGYVQNIGGPAGLPADTNDLRIYMNADTLVLQKKDGKTQIDISKKLTANSREYRILKSLKTKDFGAALCN